MTEYIFSKHAVEMMKEREISEDWVWRVLNDSENTFIGEDGNLHFSKAIAEKEHVLHVVVNSTVSPNHVITVFFDRRLRSKK